MRYQFVRIHHGVRVLGLPCSGFCCASVCVRWPTEARKPTSNFMPIVGVCRGPQLGVRAAFNKKYRLEEICIERKKAPDAKANRSWRRQRLFTKLLAAAPRRALFFLGLRRARASALRSSGPISAAQRATAKDVRADDANRARRPERPGRGAAPAPRGARREPGLKCEEPALDLITLFEKHGPPGQHGPPAIDGWWGFKSGGGGP